VICDLGDVVVVPFPFVDAADDKRRPSIILSREVFNRANGHSICAMVTTASRTNWPSDVTIDDLGSAGLSRPCVMRWKLFTLPNAIILRRAGTLAKQDRDKVLNAAREILL
jgi:mRNA interferase MazF